MTLRLTTIATIAALASGIGTASAARSHGMARDSAMQPAAQDTLTLTNSQQRMAWKEISRQANRQTAPSGFSASIGEAVPGDISLTPVPRRLAGRLSSLKPYDYVLLQDKLLIVDPNDKKVVDVINRHA